VYEIERDVPAAHLPGWLAVLFILGVGELGHHPAIVSRITPGY
jgi:hypothetical protein